MNLQQSIIEDEKEHHNLPIKFLVNNRLKYEESVSTLIQEGNEDDGADALRCPPFPNFEEIWWVTIPLSRLISHTPLLDNLYLRVLNKQWQVADKVNGRHAYLFSAYMDDRKEDLFVRIIAVLNVRGWLRPTQVLGLLASSLHLQKRATKQAFHPVPLLGFPWCLAGFVDHSTTFNNGSFCFWSTGAVSLAKIFPSHQFESFSHQTSTSVSKAQVAQTKVVSHKAVNSSQMLQLLNKWVWICVTPKPEGFASHEFQLTLAPASSSTFWGWECL